jgi:hypothetical protein
MMVWALPRGSETARLFPKRDPSQQRPDLPSSNARWGSTLMTSPAGVRCSPRRSLRQAGRLPMTSERGRTVSSLARPLGAPLPDTVRRDRMAGVTLDAGGLIAFERGDRRTIALLARAAETAARVTVPATVLARVVRRPERQVRLLGLVRAPTTDVVALDRVDARSREDQREAATSCATYPSAERVARAAASYDGSFADTSNATSTKTRATVNRVALADRLALPRRRSRDCQAKTALGDSRSSPRTRSP